MKTVPLRVDFAGGWLDVPRFSRPGGFIVNCAITPMVSLEKWDYKIGGGIGGSAAKAILDGVDPFEFESKQAGWQDPAVILETGLCVWRSGVNPVLHAKYNPDWLNGKMAIVFTEDRRITTKEICANRKDFRLIVDAGCIAEQAIRSKKIEDLGQAIGTSYMAQIDEGMKALEWCKTCIAMKYCGSGWGGYAFLLFDRKDYRDQFVADNGAIAIEPYMKNAADHC